MVKGKGNIELQIENIQLKKALAESEKLNSILMDMLEENMKEEDVE